MILDSYFGNLAASQVYLGNQLLFNRYDISTELLFDTARDKGFTLPNNRMAVDFLIRGLKRIEMFYLLDNFLLFASDLNDKVNFRMLNVVNPLKHQATPYGGLLWTNQGLKGNGANGYIDTRFNPSADGVNYTLNNASRGFILSEVSTTNFVIDGIASAAAINNFLSGRTTFNRINASNAAKSPLGDSNNGLKIINRTTNMEIDVISKDVVDNSTQPSTSLTAENQLILRRLNEYGNSGLSCYMMGASIPYEMAQQFRILFNEYLTMLNLNPIA